MGHAEDTAELPELTASGQSSPDGGPRGLCDIGVVDDLDRGSSEQDDRS